MKPSEIQKEVELTMRSLDRLRKAQAPSDFTEQLTRKMIFAEDQLRWVNRAKLALAAMIVMAILNGVIMFKNQPSQRDLMLNAIAQQYNLNGDL